MKQQHAAVERILSCWCQAQGVRLSMVNGKLRLPASVLCHSPLVVSLVRIPRKGGRLLDSGKGGGEDQCLKAPRDKVAEMLGAPNDAVDWITWTGGQRKWQTGDPSNVGRELLELTIGPAGGEG